MSAAPGSPGGDIKGTVTFTAEGPGMARVNVQVSGLRAGSGMFVVILVFFLLLRLTLRWPSWNACSHFW